MKSSTTRTPKAATSQPSPLGALSLQEEYGASGLRQYAGYVREEWLRLLIGRRGMMMWREMRDNDPIIAAIFTAVEMLLRPVPFRVEAENKNNADDQAAADFLQENFADMEHSWADFIADALSFLQYGFGVYEIVYKIRRGPDETDPRFKSQYTDGKVGWRKFAGRAQETLLHWVFNNAGDAIAMVQLLPTGGPLLTVPLAKCIHLRTTPFKNNPEGRSILRSMFWYYDLKKKIQQIEAIGVHRDLAGMVNIRVPASWMRTDASEVDKASLQIAKTMANNINNNEQSALVTPFIYDANGNEIFKVELLTTAGRRQFATTEIINRYDHGITASMLADFITLGQQSSRGGMGGHGSQSSGKSDMFSTAVIAYMDIVASEVQRASDELLRINNMKGKVKVTHGDIARRDLQELGQYIADIAQAGALVPDDTLEAHLREEGGMPPPDDPQGVTHANELDQEQQEAALSAKKPADDDDDDDDLPNGQKPAGGKKPAAGAKQPKGGNANANTGQGGKGSRTVQKRRRKPL